MREDQHPTDRFLMWNGLFDGGWSTDQIAAAVGASEKDVAKLLRFRMLAPEIFAAFQDGKMDFDAALAFTLSEDHDRQREVLASFGDKQPASHIVRQRLTKGAVRADDRMARFVGRKAYEAAGGGFMVDLFTQREIDETWTDGTLLARLFNEKVEATKAELKAEGWGDVASIDGGYGWSRGYVRITPEGEAKKGKPKPFTADQLVSGTAFILFDYNEIKIERGWMKEKKAKDTNAPLPLAKQDPARYGWGHKGHHFMTQAATEATRIALMRKPDVAMDALATQLAWAVLRKPQYGGVADQLASSMIPEYRHGRPPEVVVEGQDEFKAAIDTWKARLPESQVAFCDAIRTLNPLDKQELMALCFAATLDADEAKFDGYDVKPQRWRHLGWMAREAGVEIAKAWTPEPEFWNGGSKEALMAADVSMNGGDECTRGGKKSEMATFIGGHAAKNGWRPQVIATFTEVADPEPTVIPGLQRARSEAEYLGWMIAYLVDEEGMDDVAAEQLATTILGSDLASAGVEFGAEGYDWSEADAGDSVAEWLLAHNAD